MKKFCIKIGQDHMQIQVIKQLLNQTYWGRNYSLAQLETATSHSICFGIFYTELDKQIAFARVLTDYATRFYIMDVVVDSNFRNLGIAQQLIEAIVHYEPLQNLRGLLMTQDAQTLYEKCGFESYEITCMQKRACHKINRY